MWIYILISILALVALHLSHPRGLKRGQSAENWQWLGSLCICILTIVGAMTLYHRGMPVALPNIPHSMSYGTEYTVLGVYSNSLAIVTDDTKTDWTKFDQHGDTSYLSGDEPAVWLVAITQTNLVVGKKYVIVENPHAKKDVNSYQFMELAEKTDP